MFSAEDCYPAATISNEYADKSRLPGIRENLENRPHQTAPQRCQQVGQPESWETATAHWVQEKQYNPQLTRYAVTTPRKDPTDKYWPLEPLVSIHDPALLSSRSRFGAPVPQAEQKMLPDVHLFPTIKHNQDNGRATWRERV